MDVFTIVNLVLAVGAIALTIGLYLRQKHQSQKDNYNLQRAIGIVAKAQEDPNANAVFNGEVIRTLNRTLHTEPGKFELIGNDVELTVGKAKSTEDDDIGETPS